MKLKQGGKRIGAGRKPSVDPKRNVTLYVEESIIKKNDGIEPVKNKLYEFIKQKLI